ncbi:NOG2 (YNR053C) [Zygosaccharomyces parabailii]|uniref:Nucleolar GTP-binding protein 2 n=1 Tax=Zygosaccharomyces bailii (strain CLIB 213 / ATCC 58445 / CBS 680 / BCRC 21525 / NBRC 1098 / NCYC 1416 / NRRL Y-2227) TaxID=1333698 RepID=A0A8J2T4S3_ZYGB2|nr:NOG2 (YNR053C) [Zygosaccharomyces parabailii]CDF88027.1 BN860_00628g1_1 [Zygosaccharomyces bailii CLIB 213]SJM87334.1 probable Nucleolar GTP-binding protein 2 [Zygosaccharomyces bailii]
MGTGKKEKQRRIRQGDTRDGNLRVKGENFYRNSKRVQFLNMYKGSNDIRNKKGEIVRGADLQDRTIPTARVQPDRRWFNSTRVISQDALKHFREALGETQKDSYQVLLKRNKLPMSLLEEKDRSDSPNANILETESYSQTFGPNAQRKKPRIAASNLEEVAQIIQKDNEQYEEKQELNATLGLMGNQEDEDNGWSNVAKEAIFSKGQSKRIWNELYKVIDSSDVVIHVLDARDPLGTSCKSVEDYMTKETPHKHLIYVLNKCDLVPTWVAAAWVKHLSKRRPTLAFHASITNSFGKGSLIQLLRQFSQLHSDRKQISVGFIGYPNTGKSSIINTLRKKKVCQVAPIPGETKVWQYITLMKKIFLIDCPGIVPPSTKDTEEDILLRGVVRVENVTNAEQYIPSLLSRCQVKHLERTYEISGWDDATDFLQMLARKQGRLLKGGEPDESGVAKQVLTDFNRGKIPWFMLPPEKEEEEKIKEESKNKERIKKRSNEADETSQEKKTKTS